MRVGPTRSLPVELIPSTFCAKEIRDGSKQEAEKVQEAGGARRPARPAGIARLGGTSAGGQARARDARERSGRASEEFTCGDRGVDGALRSGEGGEPNRGELRRLDGGAR